MEFTKIITDSNKCFILRSGRGRIFSLVITLLFVLNSFNGNAQLDEDSDTLKRKKFIPTGLRVGTDVLALAMTQYNKSFSGWEVSADVDVHRYFVTVDAGGWSRNFSADGDSYSNSGSYFRLGADVNFLPYDPDRNSFFLGFRYARSRFSENMTATIDDPIWGIFEQQYSNTDVTGNWFELTGGLRVRIWKVLWLGYTARYKFWLNTSGGQTMLPHDVPGFGRNEDKAVWGFNYLVMIRLPLRNAPVPAKPSRK